MNGNDLLEALSFVDEEYIAEADVKQPRKKNRWAPVLAMAACLSLVFLGLRWWFPVMQEEATQESAVADFAMERTLFAETTMTHSAPRALGAAPKVNKSVASISPLRQVTVRVTKVEEASFLAVIAAPGPMEEGTEVTVLLPDSEELQTIHADDLLDVFYRSDPENDTVLKAQEILKTGE